MNWFLYDNDLRHERVKRIYNIQLNMCERSDTDLPNVRIMRQYLRSYATRLSTVDETTDETNDDLMFSRYLKVQKHSTN